MYKILIAEDETGLLDAMCKATPWEKCGFQQPVACADGGQAIDAIDAGFQPDVVLTDICMPFVNGLELAAYVTKHCPRTLVVILTGYDDFKFAQNAIKLQVYDYELKPITPMRLRQLLEDIREELNVRRLQRAENAMDLVRSYFLNRLVDRPMDAAEIQQNCKVHGLHLEENLTAVVLDVDGAVPRTDAEHQDLELRRYGLFNIAYEVMENKGVLVFQGKDGLTNMLVAGTPIQGVEYACEIAKTVEQWTEVSVSAGVGEQVHTLSEVYISHRHAVKALSYRFFRGERSVLCADDLEGVFSKDVDCRDLEKVFEDALRRQNQQGALDGVSQMFSRLGEHRIPFERCLLHTQRLVMVLVNVTRELLGEQELDALEKLWNEARLLDVTALAQLEEICIQLCRKAFEMYDTVRNDFAGVQVRKAEAYIKENYADPKLSLNAITEHLAISTSYFSAIFKSKTGSTFVEYLTALRMDKAKQLLAFTDLRTYETAEKVGFSDPHYFSVTFKRVMGMTPKEYREWSKKI